MNPIAPQKQSLRPRQVDLLLELEAGKYAVQTAAMGFRTSKRTGITVDGQGNSKADAVLVIR